MKFRKKTFVSTKKEMDKCFSEVEVFQNMRIVKVEDLTI